MASASETTLVARQLARLFTAPTLGDVLFVSLLVWLFVAAPSGWDSLLADGDAGWHIRTGEYILDTGKVPREDLFSFSRPGAPWFAWEWLADVVFAVLWRIAGLKGVVLFSGTVIAVSALLLFRRMLWRGANGIAALFVLLLAVGASSVHYLARPHIFTLLLLTLWLDVLDRDRVQPGRGLWLLVPLAAVWTNLHGGFLTGIASTGMLALGCALRRDWLQTRRYALLTGLCGAASLVNPYGYQLHWHIAAYLRSDWIRLVVNEFQSPNFRGESMLQFKVLLFAGLAFVPLLAARKWWPEVVWIAGWAYLALDSVRHVPIYSIVAAPAIAAVATDLWRTAAAGRPVKSALRLLFQMAQDVTPSFRRATAWAGFPVVVLALAGAPVNWPTDFPSKRFPVNMVNQYKDVIRGGRVFTVDQWADYLLYRFYPNQRVFLDGRSDFYGEQLGQEYISLMNAAHNCEQLLAKHRFSVVLVPVEWPLASVLKGHRDWKMVADDGLAVLFQRRSPDSHLTGTKAAYLRPVIAKKGCQDLMKTTDADERHTGDPEA